MEEKNETWRFEKFIIRVDEKINGFARCEFPNEEMLDIPLNVFPFEPQERERYQMCYDAEGKLQFISSITRSSTRRKMQIGPKWMRFSKRTKN